MHSPLSKSTASCPASSISFRAHNPDTPPPTIATRFRFIPPLLVLGSLLEGLLHRRRFTQIHRAWTALNRPLVQKTHEGSDGKNPKTPREKINGRAKKGRAIIQKSAACVQKHTKKKAYCSIEESFSPFPQFFHFFKQKKGIYTSAAFGGQFVIVSNLTGGAQLN